MKRFHLPVFLIFVLTLSKLTASQIDKSSRWESVSGVHLPVLSPDDTFPKTRVPEKAFLFGVINDQGLHYDDEWARGVRATTFELRWDKYEPLEGQYDQAYIDHMKGILAQLQAQGWFIQLVPGYQYTPSWVYNNYPSMYFINQFGERYDPHPVSQGSHRVINAPFNPEARGLISGYLARIFTDFEPGTFGSVRVGGGVQGELRYPPPVWNGHTNSYWAFDSHAQNPVDSGIPSGLAGWRPGIDPNPGSVDRGQLIVNPSFELSHPWLPILGWAPDDEVNAELTDQSPLTGSQALQITITTPHRLHQYVPVRPNTSYQFGGWMKSSPGAGRARLIFSQYAAGMQPLPGEPFSKLESAATVWSYAAGSMLTSPSTQYVKVDLDGDQAGTYIFDDLWLSEQGETNTQTRDLDVPISFYEWYVNKLIDYQNWQVNEIRKHYSGQLDLVYAGKGLMPRTLNDALTNDLRGDGWSENSSALYSGTAYAPIISGLDSTQNTAVYLTGIEEPAAQLVDDNSAYPEEWSAARWLAHLARSRGLSIWAENGGKNNAAQLQLSLQRMFANQFNGLMWGFESQLYGDPSGQGFATIEEFTAAIARYANLFRTFLPLVD